VHYLAFSKLKSPIATFKNIIHPFFFLEIIDAIEEISCMDEVTKGLSVTKQQQFFFELQIE
jgi:hypothetical protein